MKAALLLSGGLDSLSVAWWRRPQVAVTVDYGQLPAEAELAAAATICKELGIAHHIVRADCGSLGSGDLVGTLPDRFAPASDWWPYRNQLLITVAAMRALSCGVSTLLLGTVKSDGNHRDGTEEFVRSISSTLAIQEGHMTVEAPAIGMTTVELIRAASVPAPLLAWAHSCHRSNVVCGSCRGCDKYFAVFRELADGVD